MIVSGIVVIFAQIVLCSAGVEWSYTEQSSWPSACQGSLQSPIDLSNNQKKVLVNFHGFLFDPEYYEEQNASLTNSGHSVEIRFLNPENLPSFSGGGLEDEYVLASFHFHWDSEHTIDGRRFPLEGHFVHYAKQHEDLQTALNFENGVAVLAVFYELSDTPNPPFDNLLVDISTVAHKAKFTKNLEEPIVVSDFLPLSTHTFYRYKGSLTTPNCNEVVIWTLFSTPSYISKEQLNGLSQIWDEDDKLLKSNYRKAQNVNGRSVFFVLA